MKSFLFKPVLLILLFFFLSAMICMAQTINLNALNAYWKITTQLRNGDSLSRADWKIFTALDGNKQYISNQGFDENFLENYRKTMQIVYMPQFAKQLDKMMHDKFKYWIAYKINQYQLNEQSLKQYVTKLMAKDYLDSMYVNAWKWLPKQLRATSPSTHLFFIGIDNDALVQGDTIVFTLWSAYNQDKFLGGHELHHVLRKPHHFENVKAGNEGILYALNSILNEGSADMVDKHYGLSNLDKVPMEYDFTEILLTKPDSIIKQIDTALQALSKPESIKLKTQRQFSKLMNFSSGHDPGYYMADIIVRNGYEKALIKNVQNPFAFIYLYNKAAKKDKMQPLIFSQLAVNNVKILEKLYWRK